MRALQRLTLAVALGWLLASPGALAQSEAEAATPKEVAPVEGEPAGDAPADTEAGQAAEEAEIVLDCAIDEATGIETCVPLPSPPPDPFLIAGETVEPGTRKTIEWTGAPRDGDGRGLPVTVVHGAKRGPALCLFAAIHGDEINGIEAVRQVLKRTGAETLAGTLVGVPVVNLGGYVRGSRYLPDRRDLNRAFPGSPRGSAASRLAHALFEDIVGRCDALVDFHTGSFDRDNLPQLRADLRKPESLELARGFGATLVLHSPGAKGMLRLAASQAGVPAATFEVGAPGVLQPPMIEVAVAAIERLMAHLRMREAAGDANAAEPQPVFYESRWIRSDSPGLLVSEVELGQRVAPGQRLGRVVDPITDREVEVRSPFQGRVLGMSQNRQVLPGYALFHLGEQTSEAEAVQEAEVAPEDADVPEEEDPAQTESRD
ncbi:hypothetical protein GCM10028862_12400 [Luteimonas pelagia]